VDGTRRADVRPGLEVIIVRKEDQRTGRPTRGIVQELLTRSAVHPHGIKVRLTSGEIGRVKGILPPNNRPDEDSQLE
jgi:uncharacterized repeat protein (TIGR03833 family)